MVGSSSQPVPTSSARPRFRVLTTELFIDDLHRHLRVAKRRVAIQLMTFDGDEAGQRVADQLLEATGRGVEVHLLVDSFALRFVSDQLAHRRAVRREYDETLHMYERLRRGGVRLRFTNPNGPLRLFSVARNHKKLFVIDDIVYLGGVNISDHNFSWHDFMVRIDQSEIHRAVLDDFHCSFSGSRQVIEGPIVTNEALERTFDDLVRTARHRVVVASPYAVDRRLAELLEQAPAGDKSVIVATENNFRSLQLITPYVTHRLAKAGARLFTYRRFSHAKFVLADDRLLIGSSNFGRHSFWCNQEVGLVIEDARFIDDFVAVMLDDLDALHPSTPRRKRWLGWVASGAMVVCLKLYARLIAPHVPLLRTPPEARSPMGRLLARLGERSAGRF